MGRTLFYIQQHRPSGDYRIIQHVMVGENAPWHSFDPIICQVEMELAKIDDASIRDAVDEKKRTDVRQGITRAEE